ncbi:MFS transporter [Paraburkholderia sp. SARCC-3016]|uniref:MFS transporter n=1 Tax=Paraburkholderia sp. SARCC-3016 TaxID=3058611 RepID=UPI002806D1E4|nr:MFS transporter [Paraburkholderia sp. SARCC-3016]MDQ7981987.1 MFS transporter [Paraburkholderia sp. SARCC-3016]
MLFFITTINYADRASLSIAGNSMQHALGLTPVSMGYIFSAFAWAYVIGQLPGGRLLDRFGTRRIYALSLLAWSIFTLSQGLVAGLAAASAVTVMFALRFAMGLAEAPAFPGNSRMTSSWFPRAERGTAAAIFNAAQYFAAVLFTPIMGWIVHKFGWPYVFIAMGVLGIAMTGVWFKAVHAPKDHPRVNRAELDYIEAGGALVDLETRETQGAASLAAHANQPAEVPMGASIREMLASRMLLGIFIAQYCINALTYFFLTWFPIYLVQQRHMSILKAGFVASIPAVCGFLGGVISDALLKRGHSASFARKTPIVFGMLLSTCMIACNYVDSEFLVVAIMAAAFFGKGIGALGWAVVSDTAPVEAGGVCASLFNAFGNVAGITTPIVIGYLVQGSGSFNSALVFIGANAVVAVLCYLFVVGDIRRMVLTRSVAAR